MGRNIKKESDYYLFHSKNYEMHLQQVKYCTLSLFNDKQCYINETESKPWSSKL